ncbi:MAG: hypothetical protein QOI47_1335 [Actinomycetota bacterium]|nr:hypothetical protein [Actinomycetota bacterium]
MGNDRFVLLGLARPRAPWFADVSRWATSSNIPAEFVKCVSVEEMRARLASGRSWSAALLDGSLPMVDRDLLAGVREAGCAPVIVDDRGATHRWLSIGAAAVLPSSFDRDSLLEVLAGVAASVSRATSLPDDEVDAGDPDRDDAIVVAVCGPGGTGASTVAAALAQGLGDAGRSTLLVDLARNAEQGVLHDVRDVAPGVQELVEAHRNGVPSRDDVRSLTFAVVDRGYSLVLGLRRSRYWPSLRRRAFETAFASVCRSYDAVVCDVTADFEGESDAGSADVEERNLAGRTAIARADVVLAVGRSGVKGIHSLVRVVADLAAAGVPAPRILPVLAMAPRSPRARAELAAAVSELSRPVLGGSAMPSLVFLPARPVEQAFRDGARLPAPLPQRLAGDVIAVFERNGRVDRRSSSEPVAVAPGSLGSSPDGDW